MVTKTVKTARERKLEKEVKQLRLFHHRIAAQKAFLDYSVLRTISFGAVEPENFLDKWARQFLPKMSSLERKAFWHQFMNLLVNTRGGIRGNIIR